VVPPYTARESHYNFAVGLIHHLGLIADDKAGQIVVEILGVEGLASTDKGLIADAVSTQDHAAGFPAAMTSPLVEPAISPSPYLARNACSTALVASCSRSGAFDSITVRISDPCTVATAAACADVALAGWVTR
jgi:hypothetical protein